MLTLAGHKGAVRAVAYAPGEEPLLATGGDDRSIRLWNPVLGQEVGVMESRRDGLMALAFSPDGTRLAAGGRTGSIIAYDVATRQRDPGMESATGAVVTLAFTTGGRAILGAARSPRYAADAGRLVCWNLSPTHPLVPLGWRGDVESAAICPARDLVAIAGQFRGVEFWEVGRARGEPAFWMPGRVRALGFSPGDGRLLAVAGGRAVGIWDVDAKQWRSRCQGHRGDVQALAFSPDGLQLLTGGMDRGVRLWETLTGRQLAAWDWKVGIVNAVAFAPDSMTAAVAGEKSSVVVWDVDEG